MADIRGMINDPQFGKLSPADQKAALMRLDPDFGKLSDAQAAEFVTRMKGQPFNPNEWVQKLATGVVGGAVNAVAGLFPRPDANGQPDAPTISGLVNLIEGLGGKMSGRNVRPEAAATADQFIKEYTHKYGSWEGFKDVLQNDPASIANDILTLAGTETGAAETAAAVARRVGMAGLADTLQSGSILRPALKATGNIAGKVGRGVGRGLDAFTDVSGAKGQNWATGLENAQESNLWHPALREAADALQLGANNDRAAAGLYKSLPLVKQQAERGAVRDIPFQTNQNVGPAGQVPWSWKFGPMGGLKSAPDWHRLNDIADLATAAKEALWNRYQTEYLDPLTQAQVRVNAKPIIDAINSSPTPYARRANPSAAMTAEERAAQIYTRKQRIDLGNGKVGTVEVPRSMTVPEVQAALRGVNAELDSFEEMAAGNQQAAAERGPAIAALKAERGALQEALYGLDPSGTMRDMMAHYGSLTELQDYLRAQINNSLSHEPGGLGKALPFMARAAAQAKMGEFRGASSNIATGATKGLMPNLGAGQKLAKAIDKLEVPPADWAPPNRSNIHNATFAGPKPNTSPATAPTGPPVPSGPGAGFTMGDAPTWSMTGPPLLPGGAKALPPSDLPVGPPPPGTGFTMPPAKTWKVEPTRPQLPGRREFESAKPDFGPLPELPPGQYSMPGGIPKEMPGAPPRGAGGGIMMPEANIPPAPKVLNLNGKDWMVEGDFVNFYPSKEAAEAAAAQKASGGIPPFARGGRVEAAKSYLDHTYRAAATQNKDGGYGRPAGTLTDLQQAQYNLGRKKIEAAAKGAHIKGPSPVVVGEAGPERITHSDGRPPEIVSGAQLVTLGTHGSDKVTPLTPFPKGGIIRGSSDIALSEQGRHEARALGHHLAAAGGLDRVYTSDLGRTRETAHLVAEPSGAMVMPPDPGLRSWPLGQLEGQPATKENDDLIQHLIHAAPDQVPEGAGPISTEPGISFNDFSRRSLTALTKVMQESQADPQARIGVITHNRDQKLWRGFIKAGARPDGMVDKRELAKGGEIPGGVDLISQGPNGWQIEDFDPRTEVTRPGIYAIRHTSTDWNAKRGPEKGT